PARTLPAAPGGRCRWRARLGTDAAAHAAGRMPERRCLAGYLGFDAMGSVLGEHADQRGGALEGAHADLAGGWGHSRHDRRGVPRRFDRTPAGLLPALSVFAGVGL